MIGSSRASLATVREQVNSQFESPQLAESGRELLQIADLLGRERTLLEALSDAGRPGAERAETIKTLMTGRANDVTLATAETICAERWSSQADLIDAFELAGAQALFGAAEKAGELDRVESELFRFGRIVAADGELQLALSSPALPASAKQSILHQLLDEKTVPVTGELLGFVTSHLRGRRVDQAIDGLTTLAADRQGKLVAVVTTARPLEEEQATRLAAALERIYSQPVAMNTEVNPALVGGITVQIGDEVIDGSIAGRLETAKRRVTG